MRKSTAAMVLLLILAIPFQGFAAAMQSGCALGHHRTNPGATTLHQHDGHHDQAAMHASAAPSEADAHSVTSSATECECGACGPGTALPVSRTDMTPTLPEAAPLGRFVDPPIIMITGGPERPPRTILA
ncbi:MAG: hypothetical protein ACXW14_11515 [Burkholderiaceae bacterium]